MSKSNILKGVGLGMIVLIVGVFLYAKVNRIRPLSMVNKSMFNAYSGVAIKGYDPISFFTGVPREGSEEFQTVWKNITWKFTSLKNMNAFRINPEKYAPQFGAYCSFAVTTGYTATIDPLSYLIKDGKLYLFNGPDMKLSFMIDVEESIKTAEKRWRE